ncbi:Hypothetical Protein FCC1311_094482 [Hondaea fermentalgiana]|uniref:Sulfotransferase family protein n=1 Tax=Hondaea fermentalgiana TaxID=2315210 RepID=A0A2R5GYY8_9STRA|nr:Hypothetical Protein FCC1311_094482 [Hondaea fermentalgiana]|eukprot:GBG33224.1 Hypothetical Protein FCC1311_094482 [Hondaea fermentalgiana]
MKLYRVQDEGMERSIAGIFQDSDVAFIHVPRAGSTSLQTAIFGQDGDKLPPRVFLAAEQIEARCSYGRFQEMYRIGCVRNPWARLVSAYEALRTVPLDGTAPAEDVIGSQLVRKLGSFPAVVDYLFKLHCKDALNDSRWPLPLPVLGSNIGQNFCPVQFRPQYTFLTDADGNLLVDALFALERIKEGVEMLKSGAADTRNLGRRLNVGKMPQLCEGPYGGDIDYLLYYHDPWLVMKVSRIYERDFRLFHYDGEGPPDEQCPRRTDQPRRDKTIKSIKKKKPAKDNVEGKSEEEPMSPSEQDCSVM